MTTRLFVSNSFVHQPGSVILTVIHIIHRYAFFSWSVLWQTSESIHCNKQSMDCHAQLAATYLFTPTFFGGRFWPVEVVCRQRIYKRDEKRNSCCFLKSEWLQHPKRRGELLVGWASYCCKQKVATGKICRIVRLVVVIQEAATDSFFRFHRHKE